MSERTMLERVNLGGVKAQWPFNSSVQRQTKGWAPPSTAGDLDTITPLSASYISEHSPQQQWGCNKRLEWMRGLNRGKERFWGEKLS